MKPFHYLVKWPVIFGVLFALPTFAAELKLDTQVSSLTAGDKMVLEVSLVPSAGEAVNAFDILVNLPAGLNTLVSWPAESAGIIWLIRPAFEPVERALHLSGGLLKPATGPVLLARFLVTAESGFSGGVFSVSDQTKLLAADGQGTALKIKPLAFSVTRSTRPSPAIPITSATHPLEQKWYPNRTLKLSWLVKSGEVASYELKAGPDLTLAPDERADEPSDSAAFQNVADGAYVFALRLRGLAGVWSTPTRRLVLIDATPPEPFKVERLEQSGKTFLIFQTHDKMSGVAGYEALTEGSGAFRPAASPYEVSQPTARIFIRALDNAGNERVVAINPSGGTNFWWGILLLLALIAVFAKVKGQSQR